MLEAKKKMEKKRQLEEENEMKLRDQKVVLD